MPLRKRTRNSLLIAAALLLLLALCVFLRMKAPPETARLLPESDAILYLDLKPMHLAPKSALAPIDKYTDVDPDYQKFLATTGFNFERDLDEVAIALHQMPDPNGPNGPIAYSLVMQGRFDRSKLDPFIQSLSASKESYGGHDIFSIPVEGRTLRVTFLGYDMIATSNMPTPEQIHSIIDRYRASALPSSGSSLLAERFGDVPLLSFAWGIGRLGLPFASHPPGPGNAKQPTANQIQVMGMALPIPADATFVASAGFDANLAAALSHSGSVHVRVEEFAPDNATAESTAQTLTMLLNLYRSLQTATFNGQSPLQPKDLQDAAALQSIVKTVKIENHSNRVVLTGSVPMDLYKSTLSTAAPAK